MNSSDLLLLSAGIVAYSLLSKITTASNLKFFPQQIDGMDLSGTKPVMYVTLNVQNPTRNKLTLLSLIGNSYVNNQIIGSIQSFQPVTFQPLSNTPFQIIIQLSWLDILNDLIAAFQGGQIRQTILIEYTANVQGLPPVSDTVKYVIP